jgi:predicted metal-dependent phosphotriesterase family hydrolase
MVNFAMGRDLALMETWYQHKDINLLKATGYMMHHQFNIQ